ncbi:MAG: hypothetical protein FJ308_05640 [Planctomycetes bacterium]|nr:hypothetical protein [Planctomycetota bacterium]
MSRKTAITAILAFAMIAIWNFQLFIDWRNGIASVNSAWRSSVVNDAAAVSAEEPQLWQEIKKTVVEVDPEIGFVPTFAPAIEAAEGKRIELPGVGFLLSSGLLEDEHGEEQITNFLLLPSHGGVAWCCGLAPIPNHKFSVLVECENVTDLLSKIDPQSKAFFVTVEGTLRLQKENSINSLYTLEDAAITFMEMREVLPPNVMNLCLNQPMANLVGDSNRSSGTASSVRPQRTQGN